METNNTDNTKVFRVTAKSESKPLERETILSGTKIYSMGVKDILVDNPEYDFIFLQKILKVLEFCIIIDYT